MVKLKVYQFDYFDNLLKRNRRSVDYGTADAIMERGGTIIAESVRAIDEDLIPDSGFVRAADMPPRTEEEMPVAAWPRGSSDTRMRPSSHAHSPRRAR